MSKLNAQAAFATQPTKPVTLNVYALFNTSVVDSTNNPTSDGKRGNSLVAGGYGLCCGSLAGISGSADFGKGLGGLFQVESGFLLNRGTLEDQGQLWGRQAYMGFTTKIGPVFNIVSVGRQYGAAFAATAPLDPYAHGAQYPSAWDCFIFGVSFDSSIQDVATIGKSKILFSYSPGGVPGSSGAGTTTAAGAVYDTKPFFFGGTIAHSQDATKHSLDVYGGGVDYTHKNLKLYSYFFDTLRDPDFGDTGNGKGPVPGSTSPLANTDLALNLGNSLQRKDHYVNFAARYDLKKEYSIIGMYKFDSARQVNSAGQHGTATTYLGEFARGVSPDFFVYAFSAYTRLTGAEISADQNNPNGSFGGANDRFYVGVGVNYRFGLQIK
ncbi:porin [Terriglobus sp. ADX1]|uniref:porin n=1 Tax=Terriglobus sp. ADX1 TaxID=2794063 RepID=UPI002FE5FC48